MFIDFSFIMGLSLGVEYNQIEGSDYLVFDLLFFRIILEKPIEEVE
jgi:hypothetical protein